MWWGPDGPGNRGVYRTEANISVKMPRVSADASFFPASLPNEGMFDIVCVDSKVSRATCIKMMTSVADGSHFDMDCIHYRKAVAYRLIPHGKPGTKGYISIDGEPIEFAPFQAEAHRGLGMVLTKDGKFTGGEGLLKASLGTN